MTISKHTGGRLWSGWSKGAEQERGAQNINRHLYWGMPPVTMVVHVVTLQHGQWQSQLSENETSRLLLLLINTYIERVVDMGTNWARKCRFIPFRLRSVSEFVTFKAQGPGDPVTRMKLRISCCCCDTREEHSTLPYRRLNSSTTGASKQFNRGCLIKLVGSKH